jgi:predicted acyltransferase
MVVVNNPGDWGTVYAPLLHAPWNGWTPTDLVFPFFLFIVGVSLTQSRATVRSWGGIVRRTAVIFATGLFLQLIPRFDFANWRIPGVLQRIALCYLAAATLYRATARRKNGTSTQAGWLAVIAVLLALVYWALVSWVPVPGGSAGDLTPAHDLGTFVDRAVFGINHIYRHNWDPEGLLSTIPAVATTLLGCLAGLCLGSCGTPGRKVATLATGGVALIVAGLAWDLVFPINKNLWTSSYVAFTGGCASLVLAACYWAIDVQGWKRWSKPFEILGLNALALFVLSALLTKALLYVKVGPADARQSLYGYLYQTAYVPLAAPKNASLLFALTHLVVLFGILYVMYRRRVFVKA